jgi:hypothetical protein
MQTFVIDGIAFDIPEFLDTRVEEDRTFLAHIPFSDHANLRFTVSTVTIRGEPVPAAMEQVIRKIAMDEGCELQEEDSKIWLTYSRPASEGSPGSTISFWEVAFGSQMITISCFLDSTEGDPVQKRRVFDSVVPCIQSLRHADENA